MEHSVKFERVKGYYENNLWSSTRVELAVEKGWITAKECEEILKINVEDSDAR